MCVSKVTVKNIGRQGMKSPPKGGPTVLSLSSRVAKGLLPTCEGVL